MASFILTSSVMARIEMINRSSVDSLNKVTIGSDWSVILKMVGHGEGKVTTSGRRASRWGPRDERAEFAGMSPELPPGLTESQLKSYVVYIRLEEINRKLKDGAVLPYRERSRSPGRDAADKEEYYRKKLEDERSRLIESALQSNPEYQTDLDYNTWLDRHLFGPGARDKRLGAGSYKLQEKVWIPQREYPEINFIGLLIGPRGNTLKKMEAETGTKISIRGKGSLKEGKNDPASLAAADEELHALVMGDSTDKIEKCVRIINKIIETAASCPEDTNELKRIQLRELAALNGTLRDEDMIICSNCGQAGHRRFECTERKNVTNNLVCRICGGAGHIATDCMHRDNPDMIQQSRVRAEQMDSAYQDFLADINDKPVTSGAGAGAGASPWTQQPAYPQQPWNANPLPPSTNQNSNSTQNGTTNPQTNPWSNQ
jgi:splicing factor 1